MTDRERPESEDEVTELVNTIITEYRKNPTPENFARLIEILQNNPIFQENEEEVINALIIAGFDVETIAAGETESTEEGPFGESGGGSTFELNPEVAEEAEVRQDADERTFEEILFGDPEAIAQAFRDQGIEADPEQISGAIQSIGPIGAAPGIGAAQPLKSLVPPAAKQVGKLGALRTFAREHRRGIAAGSILSGAGLALWQMGQQRQDAALTPQSQQEAITNDPQDAFHPSTVWFTDPRTGKITTFHPAERFSVFEQMTPTQAIGFMNELDQSNATTSALGPATPDNVPVVTQEQASQATATLSDPNATLEEMIAADRVLSLWEQQAEQTDSFGGFEMNRSGPFGEFINPRNALGSRTVQNPFQLRPFPPNIPEGVDAEPVARHFFGENIPGREIPAGAELAPRAFQDYQGQPLIAWAQGIAARYKVPLNILYGMITYESGWDTDIVGDNGTSFGLAQIHLTDDAFGGQVSRSQALDPLFALDFAARRLRESYNKYGTWEAAVANHNSPVAANYLAETGQWYNAKSQTYTTDVLGLAQGSGLSNTWIDAEQIDFPQAGIGTEFGGQGAVFPVEGGTLPESSQIGLPRDGGAREHKGIDLMSDRGTNVRATVGGTVRYAENRGGNGGFAVSIIDEQGNYHYYAHLDPSSSQLWRDSALKPGATVQPGSIIGYVGNTGNARGGATHLHYSINEGRSDKALIDPFDFLQGSPAGVLPGAGAPGSVEPIPFQAPDPATSEQFLFDIYNDILGREPTNEELQSGVSKIRGFSEINYQRNVREGRGLERGGGTIDPNARITTDLEQGAEAEFVEKRDLSASFTDYVANLIDIMRGI